MRQSTGVPFVSRLSDRLAVVILLILLLSRQDEDVKAGRVANPAMLQTHNCTVKKDFPAPEKKGAIFRVIFCGNNKWLFVAPK